MMKHIRALSVLVAIAAGAAVVSGQLPTQSSGHLVTPTDWNNLINWVNASRTGALSITSQAAGDFLYASSSSQMARLAAVSGRVPYRNTSGSWEMGAGAIELDADVSVASITGNTEQSIYAFTVPANTLSTGRALYVIAQGDLADFGGTYTVRLKFGGTTVGGVQLTGDHSGAGGGGTRAWWAEGLVSGTGATNTQAGRITGCVGDNVSSGGIADTGSDCYDSQYPNLAIDTTAAKDLVLTMQHGSASGSQVSNARAVRLVLLPK